MAIQSADEWSRLWWVLGVVAVAVALGGLLNLARRSDDLTLDRAPDPLHRRGARTVSMAVEKHRQRGAFSLRYGNQLAALLAVIGGVIAVGAVFTYQRRLDSVPLPAPRSAPTASVQQRLVFTQALRDDLRTDRDSLLRLAAVLAAAGGGVIALGRFELARLDRMRADASLASERFTRAVELLADQENEAQQLGGVYALGQLARTTTDYQKTASDVLCALIRSAPPRVVEVPGPGGPTEIRIVGEVATAAIGLLRSSTVIEASDPETSNPTFGGPLPGPYDLEGAFLLGTSIDGVSFSGANISGTVFASSRGSSISFRMARAYQAVFAGAHLTWCDFYHAEFGGATFESSTLVGCTFEGVRLAGSTFTGAYMPGTRFVSADLRGAALDGVDFTFSLNELMAYGKQPAIVSSYLPGADLRGACLDGVDLSRSLMMGCDLRGASMVGANLDGTLLEGEDWDGIDRGPVIHDASTEWPANFTPPASGPPPP